MRCENCQSEVAAQVAEDGSIICGNCGGLLDSSEHPQLDAQLRQAEELLERWSKEPLLEPLEPLPGKQANHLSEVERFQAESESESHADSSADDHDRDTEAQEAAPAAAADDMESDDESMLSEDREPSFEIELHEVDSSSRHPDQIVPEAAKPKFRFDAAHLPNDAEQDVPEDRRQPETAEPEPFDFDAHDAATDLVQAVTPEVKAPGPAEPPPVESAAPVPAEPDASDANPTRRIDAAQPAAVLSPPHLDIQQLIDQRLQEEQQGFNWMVFAGQWLSYLGVLGLTAGAALIVYGYFGGTTEMVPKGWILTTAGQMLLLLGIVTLISGGLDQANSEVNTRIQVLGEQMLRFERETKEHFLRGPKIPAGQYAEDAKPAEAKNTADETAEP